MLSTDFFLRKREDHRMSRHRDFSLDCKVYVGKKKFLIVQTSVVCTVVSQLYFSEEMSRHRDFSLDCKVYVGELGHGCAKQELEDKFSKYGPLKNVWVARQPAGFAFVEFEDSRDAEDAVQALDGSRINGRHARVEMSNGRSRSRGGGRYGGPPSRPGPRYDDYRPPRRSPSPRRPRSRSRSPSPRQRRRSRSYDRYSRSRSR